MAEYVLFGGKGGVGKTTCAAAAGLALARSGRDVLVVSTDPAHSLGDAFERSIGDAPTSVGDGVSAREIDPAGGIDRYRRLFEAVADEMGSAGIDVDAGEVRDLFSSGSVPGGEELAAIEAVADALETDRDVVVFDTAPTGQTLRLLSAPEAVGTGVRTANSVREQVRRTTTAARTMVFGPVGAMGRADDEAATFESVLAELERVSTVLRDPEMTTFHPVCLPEPMVLAETERLVDRLREFGVPVGSLVVNRVLSDPDPDCARCQRVADRQADVLADVETTVPGLPIVRLPDLTGELAGRASIERLADRLASAGFTD